MALLNAFWKVFNILFPFSDFVYILQLEEYSSQRYLKWLPRFFFRRNFQVRQKVEWTARAIIVCACAVVLWLLCLVPIWALDVMPFTASALMLILVPLFVFAANAALTILFALAHARVRPRAAQRLAAFKDHGTIVVIAGSFGKTTTKHFLEQLARYNFRVQMTPGNVNTPAGIAAWVINDLKPATNLLIIEADGYSKREYQETGEMVQANIVVVTNVGDQHLERLGSRENLAEALGELVALAEKGADVVCTKETHADLPAHALKEKSVHIVAPRATNGLSASNTLNLTLAQETAEILKVPEAIIADTISKLELPDRRQKATQMYGYDAIDDSYNISWTTAQAGIAAAKEVAKAANKKLLVITAGIMELNKENADKNMVLGELLAKEADHAIVLGSMFADDIIQGLGDPSKYTLAKSLLEFIGHGHSRFPPSKWFLLHQPEMHDLYY